MKSNIFNRTLAGVCLLFACISVAVGQNSESQKFGKEASSIRVSTDLFELDRGNSSKTNMVFGKEVQSITIKTTIPEETQLKLLKQLKDNVFGKDEERVQVSFSK